MPHSKEALEKIFEAALKEVEKPSIKRPSEAYSQPARNTPAQTETFEALKPSNPIAPTSSAAVTPTQTATTTNTPTQAAATQATTQPVIDAAAANEIGEILDAKLAKTRAKRKREVLVFTLTIVGAIAGASIWVYNSPERIKALKSAGNEIRSATDVNAIVDSYQGSVDQVSKRSSQIDQATELMGAKTGSKNDPDAYMDKEMKGMMGGKGKTVGDRDKAMQSTFGDRAKEAGGVPVPKTTISKEDSFSVGK
jgi:hypothetical protein